MSRPTHTHLIATKRILWYVKGSIEDGICVWRSFVSFMICGYSNVDWVSCPDTRCSTLGFLIFHGPNLISWNSTKQPTISFGPPESLWLSYVLCELQYLVSSPALLLCDNFSTTYMVANLVFHC